MRLGSSQLEKSPDAFRTISEVAEDLAVPKHVLRFWEGKFTQLRPMKRGGGRRYYRPEDVDLLRGIRVLLYDEGYTIKGVQKILRHQGVQFVMDCWRRAAEGGAMPLGDIPDVAAEAAKGAATSQAQSALAGGGSAEGSLSRSQVKQLSGIAAELQDCVRMLAASKET